MLRKNIFEELFSGAFGSFGGKFSATLLEPGYDVVFQMLSKVSASSSIGSLGFSGADFDFIHEFACRFFGVTGRLFTGAGVKIPLLELELEVVFFKDLQMLEGFVMDVFFCGGTVACVD